MSDRYARLQPLNIDPQSLNDSTIAIVGLGATGSHMAENLARLGADLILIDRDVLEPANLTTSTLYTEAHVDAQLPKAKAAACVQDVHTSIDVETRVADVNNRNIARLLEDADLIMDGTDNLETRFLLNEYSLKTRTPWIHVSALGYAGEVLAILPDETACFNCLFADKDGAELETCETAGIMKETASTAANIATTTALSVLNDESISDLRRFNLKNGSMRTLSTTQRDDCSVCNNGSYPHLEQDIGTITTSVCGEHQYQVNPVHYGNEIDLTAQADKLQGRGYVSMNEHLLRFESDRAAFTLFKSGRALITAENEKQAKAVYSRFVGN